MVLAIFWALNCLFVIPASARRDIPDNNLAYPVLIQRDVGKGGSGFYLRMDNQIFLVTAKHVLFKQSNNIATGEELISETPIKAISYGKDPEDSKSNILLLDLQAIRLNGNLKKHDVRDIAVIRMGSLNAEGNLALNHGIELQEKSNSGFIVTAPENIRTFKSVLISNEVFLFGFPLELGSVPPGWPPLNQYDYSRPLLRKGIVAGKNAANKTLMIDLPAYHGNSGGPVIEVENDGSQKRFRVIGVVTQLVPAFEIIKSNGAYTVLLNNSGYSVAESLDAVLELTASFSSQEGSPVVPEILPAE